MDIKTATTMIEKLHLKSQSSFRDVYNELLLGLQGNRSSCIYTQRESLRDIVTPYDWNFLDKIIQVGEQFCELKKFIDDKFEAHFQDSSVGLYMLAFVEHLDKTLTPYRERLVMFKTEAPSLPDVYIVVFSYSEIFQALLELVREIDTAQCHGAAILEKLHNHFNSNVEAPKTAIRLIYKGVSLLLLTQLQAWLLYGEIVDTKNEFFVQKRDKDLRGDPFKDYCLNVTRLPSFIAPLMAEQIFSVGQHVIYLRSGADKKNESTPSEDTTIDLSGITGKSAEKMMMEMKATREGPVSRQWRLLNEVLLTGAFIVTKHLHRLATIDAKLLQQLELIKNIYLMGRGELFHEFVTQFDQQTSYGPHSDVNTLLHSCATRVLISEEVLEPFTLDLIETEAEKSFKMTYKVPWPLSLLFTPVVMDLYNLVFLFLLRLKRIQVRMVKSWLRDKSKGQDVRCPKRRQLQHNLWYLVNNLQYYLQVDVLDSQFETLTSAIERTTEFDEIRRAHGKFLSNLLIQSFLNSPQDPKGIESPVKQRLNNILKLCEDFCAQSERKEQMSDDVVDCLSLKFDACFSHLFALLAALKRHAGHPCSQHLGQLLLRLDFNRFLSSKSNPELIVS